MTLVVDASVCCKWFIEETGSARATALLAGGETLFAPDLVIAETCNVAWLKLRAGQITREQATAMAESVVGFFDGLVPCASLRIRAFALAEMLSHPVYDCFYLALAELHDTHVVTDDARLLAAVSATSLRKLARRLGAAGSGR